MISPFFVNRITASRRFGLSEFTSGVWMKKASREGTYQYVQQDVALDAPVTGSTGIY